MIQATLTVPAATHGKAHLSQEEKQAYYNSWRETGLPLNEFCRRNNLAKSSFSTWVRKIENKPKPFKKVNVDVMRPQKPMDKPIIEIIFNNSIRIRFINVINTSLVAQLAKDLALCS